jgi:hypothetical protein
MGRKEKHTSGITPKAATSIHRPRAVMGVTVVQMNQAFSNLLQQFIDEVDEADTVEKEFRCPVCIKGSA